MAKKATRIKTDTFAVRYQTRDEVEVAIKEIGDLNRELERLAIEQNDKLAAITEEYVPLMNAIKEKLSPKQDAVQAWCESRRDELTQNGKTAKRQNGKTAKLKQVHLIQAKCNGDSVRQVWGFAERNQCLKVCAP